FSSPNDSDRVDSINALKQVGMEKYKDKSYTNLSGGQIQLVMIARALVQDTPIIIMDEPTSHLDFYHENKVLSIIGKLVKEKKISVLMATHFLNHPFYFENIGLDTVVGIMNNGKIKYIGKPSEVINEEYLEDTYKMSAKISTFSHNGKEFKHVVCIPQE
ncbi:ABC transporter ATP-binding protein, partial [Romboutsia sp.]|uniref:ABC transporter ATP-binding protein n=1 Tax=Romboutsia sp. TaxID=1965302 RepID=UPI002C544E9B